MWTRLQAVVEEQAQVLIRTAFSPIVRECGDISAGVFAPDGRMLAQAVTGTPGHINTMAAAVGLMLAHVPLDTMQPGDVYTTNDPWMASGHLNDVLLVAPVFDGATPVALTACTSHLYDLGGLGMGPNGGDVHDEGLFIPPMKLVERGAVNAMLVRIFKANSRSPESNEGDLYALIACCEVGGRRLLRSAALSGLDANATTFAIELTHNGGTGARPGADGLSATGWPSGVWGSQVEVTESTVPVRVRRRELIPDSGGAGAWASSSSWRAAKGGRSSSSPRWSG